MTTRDQLVTPHESDLPFGLLRVVVRMADQLQVSGFRDSDLGRRVGARLRVEIEPHIAATGRGGRVVATLRVAIAHLCVGDAELGHLALEEALRQAR